MNNPIVIWALIFTVGLGTFALRFSLIGLGEKVRLPETFKSALKYVPAAVMGALVSSGVLIQDQQLAIGLENHRLLAVLVAGLIAWRTRNLLMTILVGLISLFLLNMLV